MSNINCPYCKEPINIEASTCPHCRKNVGMFTLMKREPKAFLYGIIFSIVGVVLAYFIHHGRIKSGLDAFSSDPGCCMCITTPVLIMIVLIFIGYAIGGFIAGFIFGKIINKNKN